MRFFTSKPRIFALLFIAFSSQLRAEQLKVSYPQGSAHGFIEVTTLDGQRIAVGDLTRQLHGDVATSRLTMRFLDGSLDDEITEFTQHRVFRLLSDHHVQRGPSFPNPIDVTIDTINGQVTSIDEHGKVTHAKIDMPADVYNGLTSTVVMNLSPAAPETRIAYIAGSTKPRLVHLSIKAAGEVPFTLGGTPRTADKYLIHVEIGGVAGIVAPLIGRQPPDYQIMITTGKDPAFIREEGPFFDGGPIWRIQQISPTFQR
jgi:hypothetical protein